MRRALTFSCAIAIFIAIIFTFFSGVGKAYAAEPVYSDVLTDLRKDAKFNVDDYPAVSNPTTANDYKFKLIQIAESEQGELLIYTYQPCAAVRELRATSINIAREQDNTDKLSFKSYPLTYLTSDGVFYKYRVDGFELRADALRYYNVSNILRPFDKKVDTAPASGTISEVENEIGQLWTACTVNGEVSYTMLESEVVTITKKYVGFFDYFNGVDVEITMANGTHTIRNFVAFSTNRDIERLIEVELQYTLQDYTYMQCASPICLSSAHPYKSIYNVQKGKPVQQDPVTIKDREVTNNPHGYGGNTYKWNTIQTTEEFKAGADSGSYKLTTEGATDIDGTQWVLSFYDSILQGTVENVTALSQIAWKGQTVSDVILLRLKFEVDGTTYNLGVVDNKQTGDGIPDNERVLSGFWAWIKNIPLWGWIIIGVIAAALVVGIIAIICVYCPPVKKVVKIILTVIGYGAYYLLCIIFSPVILPVMLIKYLVKRKEAAPAKTKTSKSSKQSKSRRKTSRSKSTRKSRPRSKRK